MSRSELWRSVTISAVIAIVFGYIGGHIIYNALEMVGAFGEDLGADPRSRLIYAESHRWVHLFAAACGLALGWFLRNRNWWLFAFSLLAILACGAYGVQNMYGFGVKNRVGVAVAKVDDKAARRIEYENARKDLQEQIRWLQSSAVQEEGRERRRLEAQVDAKRKELSALKPPVVTADNAMADTSAAGLAKLTSTSAEFQTFLWPLILAILMFLGESLSFVIVGHMLAAIVASFAAYWAAKQTVAADLEASARSLPSSTKGGSGDTGSGVKSTDESKDKPASDAANVVPIRADPAQLQATPKVSAAPRVPAPAPSASLPLSLKPTYASVEDFLGRHPSVTSQKVIADALGVSQAKVSRDIKRLKGRGKVKAEKKWRSNAITFTPRRNGGLHHAVI